MMSQKLPRSFSLQSYIQILSVYTKDCGLRPACFYEMLFYRRRGSIGESCGRAEPAAGAGINSEGSGASIDHPECSSVRICRKKTDAAGIQIEGSITTELFTQGTRCHELSTLRRRRATPLHALIFALVELAERDEILAAVFCDQFGRKRIHTRRIRRRISTIRLSRPTHGRS